MDTTIIAVLSIFIFGLIHFLFFIVRKEILWLRIAFLSVDYFKIFYATIYSTFISYAYFTLIIPYTYFFKYPVPISDDGMFGVMI